MAHLRALLILAWIIHATTPQTHDLQNPPQVPEVKDESGIRADNKSDVHFRKISDTSSYKAHGESDVGAIGPYYKLAYGIAKASMEGEFPHDSLRKTQHGTDKYEEDWKKLLDTYIGFFITVLFGVVLVIIFPIVCLGCCIYIYCCCCCKKPEPKSPREGVYRKKCCLYVTLIVLAVLIPFAIVGICLMFASNEHLRDSIHELGTSDFELLDDVTTYIRSSVDQADQLVNKDFTFSRTVLNRVLQNIGGILGEDVKQKVMDRLRLHKLYDDVINLENSSNLLNGAMEDLVASRETIIREATIFLADLKHIQAEINRIQDPRFREACPNYTVTSDRFNPAVMLPDESAKNRYLNRVISRGVYAMTLELIVEYKLLGTPNSTWLSDQIYPDKNIFLKLVDIIRSCSNGSTAYKAFKMKEAHVFGLTEIKDYGKNSNIGENGDKFDANFGNIQISTAEMLEFVKSMKTFDEKMQYSEYEEMLPVTLFWSGLLLTVIWLVVGNMSSKRSQYTAAKCFLLWTCFDCASSACNKVSQFIGLCKKLEVCQNNVCTELPEAEANGLKMDSGPNYPRLLCFILACVMIIVIIFRRQISRYLWPSQNAAVQVNVAPAPVPAPPVNVAVPPINVAAPLQRPPQRAAAVTAQQKINDYYKGTRRRHP
ncbi:uncharacterized protein LOC131942240 [Physella acuta]|uniref:uncharacterized protein LOC131942240 n=1 Tax=Physella acuta TaxID=109671 RepID=UPI0027DE30E4|nr:uncharacterized protein LOC131942240 [Physella acuta]